MGVIFDLILIVLNVILAIIVFTLETVLRMLGFKGKDKPPKGGSRGKKK